MSSKIRALVVDDSAFVRKVVSQMLARSPEIEVVGTARDGVDALEMVARFKPDVVTLDLVMPRMNGVEFLREQANRTPVPVVICSIAHETGEMALDAFEAGAVDFVRKPTALATDRVYEIADELIAKVIAASQASLRPALPATPIATAALSPSHRSGSVAGLEATAEIVVIGVSTGGPQALRHLIPSLPADFPVPIAIVLHMPVGYTKMYAERLNDISALEVIEVEEGAPLRPGVAWLAPAGQHLTFLRDSAGVVRAHLDLRPLDTQHRPAVDVLFRSAADVFGAAVLGVVMTGMGADGTAGAGEIRARGGHVITEAASSCVVYGMPRAVVEAGLSDRSAPLSTLAEAIMEML
ncbi:MAG TPA: chemotaxis response regulator protein-glutamate methylesterase [Gemmatimonadaceae bacterium]|nr:chemotaxis response regulator protein-glutamate methylesterase [Gemmatimonadaceae bacterium]